MEETEVDRADTEAIDPDVCPFESLELPPLLSESVPPGAGLELERRRLVERSSVRVEEGSLAIEQVQLGRSERVELAIKRERRGFEREELGLGLGFLGR